MNKSSRKVALLLLTLLLLGGFAAEALAQVDPPEVEWEAEPPVARSPNDGIGMVRQTEDGGYVTVDAGVRSCSALGGVYLWKVDGLGRTDFERRFGGSGRFVHEMDGGGYLVGGSSGDGQILLFKTDARGVLISESAISGPGSESLYFLGTVPLRQGEDGGFIIAANSRPTGDSCRRERSRGFLVRLDVTGGFVWQRSFGNPGTVLRSVEPATDGGYVVAGDRYDGRLREHIYLAKLTEQGRLEWERTYFSAERGEGHEVRRTLDGHYVLGGWLRERGAGGSGVVIKIDALGDPHPLWEIAPLFGAVLSVERVRDGGYIVGGGVPGSFITKLGTSGTVVWTSSSWKGGTFTSVLETRDGGYIAGRYSSPLLKLAPEARPLATFVRGESNGDNDVNLADAVHVLNHLSRSGPAPVCADAADADDNGDIQITDAVYILNFLFLGRTPIPAPSGPECGADPTDDALDCASFGGCGE